MISSDASIFPRIVDVGLSGMLVTFSDVLSQDANRAALALRARLEDMQIVGVLETTTSLTSTFVVYDPKALTQDLLRRLLTELLETEVWNNAPLPEGRRLCRIPAVFDHPEYGPQLQEAADLAGITVKTAVESLCDTSLRVMTLGFAPGQPYLGALAPHWDIPRQTGLTKQVPVGAITVAIRQIVLFSTASPTGWRQVGQCVFRAFRPELADPFALRPGDEVSFYPVSAEDLARFKAKDETGDGGATWETIS
ncbi:allophanate hydrolase subunit 1 [Litoreibacter sp.]|nr:allophanate hydrolase subunit 1 [Litoreibacter sp.]